MTLAQYLLATVLAWSHLDAPMVQPYTDAVAAQARDSKEALLLIAQAKVEGGWVEYVIDGRCNTRAWLDKQRGCHVKGGWCPCDAGLAVGPLQMHDIAVYTAAPEYIAEGLRRLRAAPAGWTTWRAARTHATWWTTKHAFDDASFSSDVTATAVH